MNIDRTRCWDTVWLPSFKTEAAAEAAAAAAGAEASNSEVFTGKDFCKCGCVMPEFELEIRSPNRTSPVIIGGADIVPEESIGGPLPVQPVLHRPLA